MFRIFAGVVTTSFFATVCTAQIPPTSGPRARLLENAARLGNAGDISAARAMIDSLIRTTPSDSPELAEILFARATFAMSALDASFDYERIISELPSSARREESLLRIAQRALISEEAAKALDYLRTISRDFPGDPSQALAGYWIARALLDSHDVTSACEANRDALKHARAASSPLLTEIETQARVSCAGVAGDPIADAAPKRLPPIAATFPVTATPAYPKLYGVQVSAFATHADAEAMSQRLRRSGFDSHVDGTVRPFRVRIGHYKTYAEAANALRGLKTRKLSGFVAELSP